MLKQAIVACPAWIWNAPADKNKFWNVAYHALFFTHAYLEDSEGKPPMGKRNNHHEKAGTVHSGRWRGRI